MNPVLRAPGRRGQFVGVDIPMARACGLFNSRGDVHGGALALLFTQRRLLAMAAGAFKLIDRHPLSKESP